MPTAACGIQCDACRLKLIGVCSTCGSGRSEEAWKKMAAQVRILGAPCPILECAVDKKIEYCLRDCAEFPCEILRSSPYPFSDGFLMMQERRRKETFRGKSPVGQDIQVPGRYWEDLGQKDLQELCQISLAEPYPPEGLLLRFVNEPYLVDLQAKCVKRAKGGVWEKVNYDLLELILLVYLLGAKEEGLGNEMITVQQLKDAHFFQGPHALHIAPLVERYGRDAEGFREAVRALGAELLHLADASCRIQALPRVPVYYLLWEGDEEFEPRLSVLFDRSVEKHLTADAIWGLVTLVTIALVRAKEVLTPSGPES